MKDDKKQEIVKKQDVGALRKTFADSVMTSINKFVSEKRLVLPKGYSPENALKSAWLIIQETTDRNGKKALEVCTPESVANALLEMVIMGLNPAKKQCYFIVYGNKLTLFVSYFGKMTVLKRINGIENINAQAIYDGDDIDYFIDTDGSVRNIKHKQSFANIKEENLIGAYCVITYKEKEYGTILTMEQIQEAWNKSKTTKDKKEFKSEFAKRTAVNRAIKWFVNTRDDEDLLIETISNNENRDYEYEEQEEIQTTTIAIDKEENIQDAEYDEQTGEITKELPKVEEKNDTNYIEFE